MNQIKTYMAVNMLIHSKNVTVRRGAILVLKRLPANDLRDLAINSINPHIRLASHALYKRIHILKSM